MATGFGKPRIPFLEAEEIVKIISYESEDGEMVYRIPSPFSEYCILKQLSCKTFYDILTQECAL